MQVGARTYVVIDIWATSNSLQRHTNIHDLHFKKLA